MTFFERIADDIIAAAVTALGEGAQIVSDRAKARAPVRNVFGVEYAMRGKSIAELEASRAALSGIPDAGVGSKLIWKMTDVPRGKVARSMQRRWRDRRSSAAEMHLAAYDEAQASRTRGAPAPKTMLSRTGAYEVRSKRARFLTFGHSMVGGRLRGEIYAERPTVSGKTAEAWVISPTRYARFMEYGSRHNAAHPYLRPAAEESRAEVRSLIAAAVREASRTGGSQTAIEIVVRI